MKSIEAVYEVKGLIELIITEVGKTNVIEKYLLEEAVINHLAKYIEQSEDNINHIKLLRKMVFEKVHSWKDRYRRHDDITFTETSCHSEGGEEIEFEPVDVLADVESEVMAKEMTALLAQDDHRKKLIVGSWKDGNENNTVISRLLAQSLGGNPESHRKFIQRFRTECRDILAAAI